jgi:hypothetical protein
MTADKGGLERLYADGTYRAGMLREKPRYYMGVDLGQAQDYTAIVLLEQVRVVLPERDPITWSFRTETLCQVRYAERVPLGTPYPEVAEYVRRLTRREPVAGQVTVVADATGVGAAVVDLLRRGGLGARVIPVVITGWNAETSDGVRYRVPKRDLMAGLQVAFQKRRLGLAKGLEVLPELREELRSMRVRVSAGGFERCNGRVHDDLVLALALAWWRAGREGRG